MSSRFPPVVRHPLPKASLGGERTIHVTARDVAMLTWLTRLQCATYEQLADLTNTSVQALRQRLRLLHKGGLVVRVDGRRGDRPIARWFPTTDGAAKTGTGINPADPDQVDTVRSDLLAAIALPHYQRGDQLLAGEEVEAALEKAALRYALRAAHPIVHRLPSPDLLIQCGANLMAVEVRLGEAAKGDWLQRLLNFEHLGVHRLLLYTDSVLLRALLGSPAAYPARVFVTVKGPGDDLLDDNCWTTTASPSA